MIDSHAHLTDKAFNGDVDLLKRASNAGLKHILTLGYNMPSSEDSMLFARENSGVFFAAGVHPSNCEQVDNGAISRLLELADDEKCVAIGEIGLDYHYANYDKEKQAQAFKSQIEVAYEKDLPFIVHSREASKDVTDIIRDAHKRGLTKRGFLLHCYSESKESAEFYAACNGYFAFGGSTTYKNAKKEDIIRSIPLDRLLCETDCPYLTPEPLRGKRNEPANVTLVYEKIADVCGLSVEKLAEITSDNFFELFKKADKNQTLKSE